MYRPLCICEAIGEVRTALAGIETRIVILMHVRELALPTNTARLAEAAIPHCEIRLRGAPGEPADLSDLEQSNGLLLFPLENAEELCPSPGEPVTLVVPDGSWRQAHKATGREPVLKKMPSVKLPPGPPSRYRLRKEPNEQSLCTFEAISRALGVLEGDSVQRQLDALFETRVNRGLWARGLINAQEAGLVE